MAGFDLCSNQKMCVDSKDINEKHVMIRDNMGNKRKLTLSVDPEVVAKAKRMGINISQLVEKILVGFTFEPSPADVSELRAGYKKLFSAMTPLLGKLNVKVCVAEGSLVLCSDGKLRDADGKKVILEDERCHPLSPGTVLSNFVDAIAVGAKRRRWHLREIEMARRIIKVVSGSMRRK